MNTKQEGLNVVSGAFERKEGTGACFPQFDGSVSGDARIDGRLYEVEADIRPRKKSLVLHMEHGTIKVDAEIPVNPRYEENDRAPRWSGNVEIKDKEYRVSVWLSWTKRETRFLSMRFSEIIEVDDKLMDKFDFDMKPKATFLDTFDNDSRYAVRDPDVEMEPDLLSGPGRAVE
ncbi:MAG: hypothetical protein D6698_15335 [Gammaproteobacteria bacterium]|nr:MAG: hypothetical protein D6698_15335 [Gammaproteobacteria bacterium]